MSETTTLSEDAQKILDEVRRIEEKSSAIWSRGDIATRTGLTEYYVKKVLPELVKGGHLVTVREEHRTVEARSLLYGVYGARGKATYYMLPERLEKLKEARVVRVKAPVWKKAQKNILDKYADEVAAEFERLWAIAQADKEFNFGKTITSPTTSEIPNAEKR